MHRLTRSLSTFVALMIAPAALHAHEKPPAFEDFHHVPCGCYLSTVAFLHRFLAAYPAERGQMINSALLNDGGAERRTLGRSDRPIGTNLASRDCQLRL